MKVNLKQIRARRVYSPDFKQEIVSYFESGKFSVGQLNKLYGIAGTQIYRWIYKYSTFNEKNVRVVEMKDSHLKKLQDLEKKVKELERAVGQKQIKIDYLEKMIDIAKTELDIDIKKNFSTSPSPGSKSTGKS